MNKNLLLEKYIRVAVKKALKEQEEKQRKAEKAMYLVYRFPGLKKIMEDLMSPAFGRYVNEINILSPKPTTFKIDLINGQDFNIKYVGKSQFSIKIAGKKYNPINLGELERASQAISDLLELNYAPSNELNKTNPNEQQPSGAELGADLSAANNSPEENNQSPENLPGAAELGADLSAAENKPEENPKI